MTWITLATNTNIYILVHIQGRLSQQTQSWRGLRSSSSTRYRKRVAQVLSRSQAASTGLESKATPGSATGSSGGDLPELQVEKSETKQVNNIQEIESLSKNLMAEEDEEILEKFPW